MTYLSAAALLLPAATPIPAGLAPTDTWRGVSEAPGRTPADMAVEAGRAALSACDVSPERVGWVLHGGSGYQGPMGWPVHHRVQDGIVGANGNALELKQYCAGGLTALVVGGGLLRDVDEAVVCTGADNWSWGDRLAATRSIGGEPFADVAHAALLSRSAGFARVLGHGTTSVPVQAEHWRTRERFWEHATLDDYEATYRRAVASSTPDSRRDSAQAIARTVGLALHDANVTPESVTHFVPHASSTGEPYRAFATAMGLPWSEDLHQRQLDYGYLGVSNPFAGLAFHAENGLPVASIVLLLAVEYQMGATAIVLEVVREPTVTIVGEVKVVS